MRRVLTAAVACLFSCLNHPGVSASTYVEKKTYDHAGKTCGDIDVSELAWDFFSKKVRR